MTLSILIPTTSDREVFFADVMSELCRQVRILSEYHNEDYWRRVEILKDPRGTEISIGQKRNDLLQAATGKYVAFVDSDDMVSGDYVETILDAATTSGPEPIVIVDPNPDALSLQGIMTTDGANPEVFEHSIQYSEWRDNGAEYPRVRYERFPNHLNAIRASIAKQFRFPESNHGEDHAWSKLLHESGLIKNEVFVDKVLYYYKYRTGK